MTNKTLIKPLKTQKSQKRKNSVYSVFSVVEKMAKMVDKYCSKQDKQHSGLLSKPVYACLFNNRFIPAMSDKTLIKPQDFTDRDFNAENAENAEKKTFFSLISVTSANSAMKNSCVICG